MLFRSVPEFAYRKGQMINVKGIAAAMLRTTKNGGTLTIIDDAAKPGTGFTQVATLGRVDEDAVKAEVLSAGWVLDGESKALARTSDPRTAASRDMFYKDDQFILRFKKPATANTNNDRQIVDALRNHFGNTSHSGFDSKSQRWVFYQEDGTFQEYGNTGSWEQQGRVYWDTDGRRCMLKDFPRWERGAVMCHYMLDQLTKKVGDVWTRGTPQKYRLEKGYVFPAAPTREQIESPMW